MACIPSLLTPAELSDLSLLTSAWRYEAWLHAYPLNRATVLDYFKHSPFYSLTANNERINAAALTAAATQQHQQQQQQQQQHGHAASVAGQSTSTSASSSFSSLSALRHMEGLEYALDTPPADTHTATANPSYFVLRKQWRLTPSVVHLLAMYYVVATIESTTPSPSSLPVGSVIPMPHFHSLTHCALDSSAATLTAAIQALTRIHGRHTQKQQQHAQVRQADEESQADDWQNGEDEYTAGDTDRLANSGESNTQDEPATSTINQPDLDDASSEQRTNLARPLYAQMAADAIRMMTAG